MVANGKGLRSRSQTRGIGSCQKFGGPIVFEDSADLRDLVAVSKVVMFAELLEKCSNEEKSAHSRTTGDILTLHRRKCNVVLHFRLPDEWNVGKSDEETSPELDTMRVFWIWCQRMQGFDESCGTRSHSQQWHFSPPVAHNPSLYSPHNVHNICKIAPYDRCEKAVGLNTSG